MLIGSWSIENASFFPGYKTGQIDREHLIAARILRTHRSVHAEAAYTTVVLGKVLPYVIARRHTVGIRFGVEHYVGQQRMEDAAGAIVGEPNLELGDREATSGGVLEDEAVGEIGGGGCQGVGAGIYLETGCPGTYRGRREAGDSGT
jgi:hypothetical protein